MGLPFRSKRERPVERDEPTPFQAQGGWAPAEDAAAAGLDPLADERDRRHAGRDALAALYREQAAERRAAMEARLAGVQRGRDYGKRS